MTVTLMFIAHKDLSSSTDCDCDCGRLSYNSWVSACRNYVVPGPKSKGRSRKTWDECVRYDLRSGGLNPQWAQNRSMWKSLIVGKTVQPVHAWRGGRS